MSTASQTDNTTTRSIQLSCTSNLSCCGRRSRWVWRGDRPLRNPFVVKVMSTAVGAVNSAQLTEIEIPVTATPRAEAGPVRRTDRYCRRYLARCESARCWWRDPRTHHHGVRVEIVERARAARWRGRDDAGVGCSMYGLW